MKVQVSELIVKFLERLGVDTIFGMPGAHILPVYDSLYDSPIQSVLAKHEQGAAFMACGYARASGRIAACITTAGPGATNLVTGIANAYVDRQPVVVITGETPTYIFGKGGLQESSGEGGSIDQSALFKGITRYNKIVERTDYLAHVLNRAAKVLLSDNPGPVLLSLPYNLQKELVDLELLEQVRTQRPQRAPHHQDPLIERLAELFEQAERPVIVGGYGVLRAGARRQVQALSEGWNIPVTSSLKGKGAIDERSELSLGSLGVTSSGYAYDYIVNRADLVLVLGASFNERTSYLWNEQLLAGKTVVQIDIDHDQLDKVYTADLSIHADIGQVLDSLLQRLAARACPEKQLEPIPAYKQAFEAQASAAGNSIFQAEFSLVKAFFERLNRALPAGAALFDDNIIFAQNLLQVSAGVDFYPNSGISSLGHAIPAAIGAQFAGRRPMFAIIGDGGFQMCCMELMTAVNYGIPLTVILFNNASMGLIRKNQVQSYQGRFIDCDFINPDYGALARSFGIWHRRVEAIADLGGLFADLNLAEGINLIEILVDKDAFPNYSSRR